MVELKGSASHLFFEVAVNPGGIMRFVMNSVVLAVLPVMWMFPVKVYGDQSSVLAEVHQYSERVAQFQIGKSTQSLDDLFIDGDVLADELAEVLESLSVRDYELAQQEMKGFFVFREEIVGVQPRWKFFQELAKIKGSEEDIGFFNFMAALYGDDIRPVYEEQVTDYSSCGSYGDGTRTKLYLSATKIKPPVNLVYQRALNKAIADLKQSLVDENICVCEGPDSAIRELSLFLKKTKDTDFRPDVEKLLAKIKAGKSNVRFFCHPG
jgi:hypothetical protein